MSRNKKNRKYKINYNPIKLLNNFGSQTKFSWFMLILQLCDSQYFYSPLCMRRLRKTAKNLLTEELLLFTQWREWNNFEIEVNHIQTKISENKGKIWGKKGKWLQEHEFLHVNSQNQYN